MEVDSSSILGSDFSIEQRKRKIIENLDLPLAGFNTKKQHQSSSDDSKQDSPQNKNNCYSDEDVIYATSDSKDNSKTNSSDDMKLTFPFVDSEEDEIMDGDEGIDDDVFPSSFAGWRITPYNVSRELWPESYAKFEDFAKLAIAKYNHDHDTHFEVVKVEQLHARIQRFTDYYVTFTAYDSKAAAGGIHDQDAPLVTIQAILSEDGITDEETDVWFCRIKPN